MDGLKVLLIEKNAEESARISSVLADGNHDVLPANGFEDASEALLVQRFDAVLVGMPDAAAAAEFANRLRQLERTQRNGERTAILSFAREGTQEAPPGGSSSANAAGAGLGRGVIDGYLPRQFHAAAFSEAVSKLGQAVGGHAETAADDVSELPVFQPEEFQAQVAHDRDLLIEIIDLFVVERVEQIDEIRNALAAEDYTRLSRAAHTIKGSLASLHAQQAKAHAQQIEYAAKNRQGQVCRFALAQLEQDLEILEPYLLALREESCK